MPNAVRVGLLLAMLMVALPAHGVPAIEHPVNDHVHVLTTDDVERISAAIVAHRESTGIQIAVLLVDRTWPQPIEDFALEVAEAWEGGSRGRDDGLLFVIAVDDREMRLEMGYGLEAYISDGQARTILEGARDPFRAGDYGQGILQVVNEVIARTGGIEPGDALGPPLGIHFRFAYLVVLLLGTAAGFLLSRHLVSINQARNCRSWIYVLAGCVAVVGVIAFLFRHGEGFWWGYALVYLLAGSVTYLMLKAVKGNKGRRRLLAGFLLATVGNLFIPWHPSSGLPIPFIGLAHLGAALFLAGMIDMILEPAPPGSRTYSSSGYSSWNSSSSSWSSSSSSSSSSSGSSSSQSWSGGGGHFGGGGASCKW